MRTIRIEIAYALQQKRLLSRRAATQGSETLIEGATTGEMLARFPIAFEEIANQSCSRQWAGSKGIHVYMIALEGGTQE